MVKFSKKLEYSLIALSHLSQSQSDVTRVRDISEKYTQYEEDGVMAINDDIFAEWFDDVYDNIDE